MYMEVPYGIRDAGNICRLEKAIYGLKQAASPWHKTTHRAVMKIGADECVYVKANEVSFVYICLYVDDMIIAAKTTDEIQRSPTERSSGVCCILQRASGSNGCRRKSTCLTEL
ncbi:Hypothetical protein PHPALM_7979 [Phytophthora palmivora]|uniref:Reverse transcriptase Ty1/copia-type domain-containing protein n=1 Tax=Phytophthora palmivora TaxID=4796 RepID=A0A2P4YAY9_9STRA|nr:Hypothetical protein PHPALM_7979 [Phytophthora palmivora]